MMVVVLVTLRQSVSTQRKHRASSLGVTESPAALGELHFMLGTHRKKVKQGKQLQLALCIFKEGAVSVTVGVLPVSFAEKVAESLEK